MQTNRIFQGDDQQWYFHVRGNQAVGPFGSSKDAEMGLGEHVKTCQRRVDTSVPSFPWPRGWTPSRLLRKAVAAPRHG